MALPWIFVSKNTNYKDQITNKSQVPIFNDQNRTKKRTPNVEPWYALGVSIVLKMRSEATPTFDVHLFPVCNFEFWSPVLRSSLLRRMDWNLFDIWDLVLGILISQ